MDGTLTVPSHDFEAVRAELGIPRGEYILEFLDSLPEQQSAPMHRRLEEIEWEHAHMAKADPHAQDLLENLRSRAIPLGIVTRNSSDIAKETLKVCGLSEFFKDDLVIAREHAAPKPDPSGVNLVLDRVAASADESVFVGDFVHDLSAGRAAGVSTVWIDHSGDARFTSYADHVVRHLGDLMHPNIDNSYDD